MVKKKKALNHLDKKFNVIRNLIQTKEIEKENTFTVL